MAVYVVTWDFSTTIRDKTIYGAMADAARTFFVAFKDNATEITETTWAIDSARSADEILDAIVRHVGKHGSLVTRGKQRDYLMVQRAFPQRAALTEGDDDWFKISGRRWK